MAWINYSPIITVEICVIEYNSININHNGSIEYIYVERICESLYYHHRRIPRILCHAVKPRFRSNWRRRWPGIDDLYIDSGWPDLPIVAKRCVAVINGIGTTHVTVHLRRPTHVVRYPYLNDPSLVHVSHLPHGYGGNVGLAEKRSVRFQPIKTNITLFIAQLYKLQHSPDNS